MTTPQAVSAAIRRAGVIIPTPRSREGTHVTRSYGGTVSVSFDYDHPAAAERAEDHVINTLTAAGYQVWEAKDGSGLRVSRDA